MKNEINLEKYQVRTDLIIESIARYKDVKGIKETTRVFDDISVTEVELSEEASKTCGKKKGIYKTITFSDVTDSGNRRKVEDVFVKEFSSLLSQVGISNQASCLVVGLGNSKSTPDSLGPKVIEDVLVTRHLFLLEGSSIEKGYRNVAAFSPNVMGTTGIESHDFMLGLIHQVKPDFLIVVDALAASSIERVNQTIQMTDTGIAPGSGVGNGREEISFETVGIPVIAIGVPTIVDAVTIVSDTFQFLVKQISYNKENLTNHKTKLIPSIKRNYLDHDKTLTREEEQKLLGLLGNLSEEERRAFIFEVLTPIGYNLMVTPKEVDFVVSKLSQLLSTGLNRSLHQAYNERRG